MTEAFRGSGGYTIIELALAITIIGILTTLALSLPASMRVSARDQERADDIASLVRRMEQSYSAQEVGGPGYPSTSEFSSALATRTGVAARIDDDTLKAPGITSPSVVMATSNSITQPVSSGPSKDQYVYQPLTNSGALCSAANSISSASTTCVRFNFYYRAETDNEIKRLKSFYQQ